MCHERGISGESFYGFFSSIRKQFPERGSRYIRDAKMCDPEDQSPLDDNRASESNRHAIFRKAHVPSRA